MEKQRLDKFISGNINNLSRSLARTAVRRGKATVNGQVVRDPSAIIDVDIDTVCFEGQAVKHKKYVYILMNKPAGVLSASNDKSRKTVVDLVPPEMSRAGLFPVGRLDKDTTGLLLITDDGEFAHSCISPKFDVPKTYLVTLDGEITDDMIKLFFDGVTLADGYVCRSAVLERAGECRAHVTITEGKYHQVKRMFGVVGLGVNALHREAIGHLTIPENLEAGECIELENKPF